MEPIAIIGIGCRFPQANNPQTFWQLLKNGQQAITSIPQERWSVEDFYHPEPKAIGKMNSCQGGFLENVDRFDAAFFGIDDEEARHIDPQQRLFLEVAWEALEYASISPRALGGTAVGVFTGLCTVDYHRLLYRDFGCIGPYSGTGTTMSITANRLSYLLDLRGPSMAVDAACSSGLVALHLACQSLRTEESNLCIAGGVNLILSPDSMISSAQTGLLSAGGACRPFDAEADGYVRAEGCGVVVLKRLSDAKADGDNILALVRGSAVNQDGLSNSLTSPNGLAQQALIQRALQTSGVAAKDIDYVEAHAVGTPLGDAIEFRALKKVLMQGRHQPCWVGSLKSNIGHLEAASGMAALIKVVLSLCHEEIPPQLNFQQANAYVDLEENLFEISATGRPWRRQQKPRLAGVSTFGFGGTNAHVVIEESPATVFRDGEQENDFNERPYHLLTLSAKSDSALRHLAHRYLTFLKEVLKEESASDLLRLSLADICFTANTGRSHFAKRLCLVSYSLENLQQQLAEFVATEGFATEGFATEGVTAEEIQGENKFIFGQVKGRKRHKLVFHFPEPTADIFRLGKMLYRTQPAFRQVFEQCAEMAAVPLDLDLAHRHLGQRHRENTSGTTTADTWFQTDVGRLTGFSISYSLASMWRGWGIHPSAVSGEGLGEWVAACVAGDLGVEAVLANQHGLMLPRRFSLAGLSAYDMVLTMGAERTCWPQLLFQLGQLFVTGAVVDWVAFDRGYRRSRLPLPTYPFERSSYWFAPVCFLADVQHLASEHLDSQKQPDERLSSSKSKIAIGQYMPSGSMPSGSMP